MRRLDSQPAWRAVAGYAILVMVSLGLSGCKSSYYRKDADKEVYKIIDQVEQEVFGVDKTFNIDTEYSPRDPEEVPVDEIVRQRQEPGQMFLTIEQALDLAIKNSREYQTQKEQLYLTALTLTGERYEFSPRFFARSAGEFTRTEDGERFGTVNSQVGVTQMLKSGASIGATLANDYLRYYTGDPRKSVLSTISVNLFQPLLRGAGPNVATENLKQAERNVIYAMRSYTQFQHQFAVDVVVEYFRLLQSKDQLRNAYEDYKLRLETIRYTEKRGEAGLVTQVDVDEARSDELEARNTYIFAATSYRNDLDRFKLTLGLPLTTKIQLDDKALEGLMTEGLKPIQVDDTKAFQLAVDRQLELLNDIDRYEDSKRKVVVAADRLKADLNLFADASLRSEEPTDYTDFDINDVRAGVGIELDLPIDRLRERNDYRATLIGFESSVRALSLNLDEKKDEIDRGLRNLESLRRSYEIQTNSVLIAERRVAGEQLNLKAGRRTVRDVSEAQDTLVDSQNAVTADLVAHLAAKLQLLLDVGILNTEVTQFWTNPDAVVLPNREDYLKGSETEVADEKEIIPPEQIFQL